MEQQLIDKIHNKALDYLNDDYFDKLEKFTENLRKEHIIKVNRVGNISKLKTLYVQLAPFKLKLNSISELNEHNFFLVEFIKTDDTNIEESEKEIIFVFIMNILGSCNVEFKDKSLNFMIKTNE